MSLKTTGISYLSENQPSNWQPSGQISLFFWKTKGHWSWSFCVCSEACNGISLWIRQVLEKACGFLYDSLFLGLLQIARLASWQILCKPEGCGPKWCLACCCGCFRITVQLQPTDYFCRITVSKCCGCLFAKPGLPAQFIFCTAETL